MCDIIGDVHQFSGQCLNPLDPWVVRQFNIVGKVSGLLTVVLIAAMSGSCQMILAINRITSLTRTVKAFI